MIFNLQNFTSSSGLSLPFKIECDSLDWLDWECIAVLTVKLLKKLNISLKCPIIGCATGGWNYQYFMKQHLNYPFDYNLPPIIVDDVFTTGRTIKEYMKVYNSKHGVVVFARGDVSIVPGVHALFTLNNELW